MLSPENKNLFIIILLRWSPSTLPLMRRMSMEEEARQREQRAAVTCAVTSAVTS